MNRTSTARAAAIAIALLLTPTVDASSTLEATYLRVNYSDDGLAFLPTAEAGIEAYIGSTPDWYEFTYYSSSTTTIAPFIASSFYYEKGGVAYEYAGYVQGTTSADYGVDWTTLAEEDVSGDGLVGAAHTWEVGDLEVTKTETWAEDGHAIFVHFAVTNTAGSRVRNFRYMHLVDPADTTSRLNSTNTRNDLDDRDGDGVVDWAQSQGRSTATSTNNRTLAFGLCDPADEEVNFKDGVEVYLSDVDSIGFEGDPGGSSSNFQLVYLKDWSTIEPGDTMMFGLVIATGTRDSDAETAFDETQARCWDLDGDGEDSADFGGEDCDDFDASVNTGAEEIWYDGYDQDCGKDDDYDQDGDGYVPDEYEGLKTYSTHTEGAISGTGEAPAGDCDDTDASVNPGAREDWYNGIDEDCAGDNDYDQDGDGYVEDAFVGEETVDPGTGEVVDDGSTVEGGDCDDTDENVYAGAEEIWYDGYDQDCGEDDDYDQDGDGYASELYADSYGPTYVPGTDEPIEGTGELDSTDCDDTDEAVHPGSEETWYDGLDGNCDGGSDFDADGDGYVPDEYAGDVTFDPATGEVVDDGTSTDPGDCDDNDAETNPGAEEDWYNGIDEDCGGDDDYDQDGDGYADADHADEYGPTTDTLGNEVPGTGDLDATDCDDTDAEINPGAEEEWYDDEDEDCDGNTHDRDGDGYPADGYDTDGDGDIDERDGGDCDDTDDEVSPGAEETWYDGLDQDCGEDSDYDQDGDGHEDDGYPDDSMTYDPGTGEVVDDGSLPNDDCDDTDDEVSPGADETWYDGIDQDCAGDDDYDADGDGHASADVDYGPTYSDSDKTEEIPGTGELVADDCYDLDPDVYECAEVPSYKGGGGCTGCATGSSGEGRLAGLAGILGVLGALWRRRRER